MKLQILSALILVMFSLSSSASWYQESCSNATQTILRNQGHDDVRTVISRQLESGETTPVEYEYDDVEEKILSEKKIKETSEDHNCWASWSKTTVREMKLTRTGGKKFPQGTVDVSRDGKTVRTFLLCQHEMTGETPECRGPVRASSTIAPK